MEEKKLPIILFCYPGSVFSRRMSWYLDLRKIPYTVSVQPNILPRPLLRETLHIHYRRIPILAVGRSVYCDTRCIIAALETLFPASAAHPGLLPAGDAAAAGVAKMLELWTTDPGLFMSAVGLIPAAHPMLQNAASLRDREDMAGFALSPATMAAARPEGFVKITAALAVLESTFLADGRKWILGGGEPSLADLHAVWIFDWLVHDPPMKEALGTEEERKAVEGRFPRAFEWMARWRAALRERGAWDAEREGVPHAVSDEDVAERIFGAAGFAEDVEVDAACAGVLGLESGALVEVFPTDNSVNHHDRGVLVGLDDGRVVIEKDVPERKTTLRVHFPRTNFRIQKAA